jgi:hypothetical protein
LDYGNIRVVKKSGTAILLASTSGGQTSLVTIWVKWSSPSGKMLLLLTMDRLNHRATSASFAVRGKASLAMNLLPNFTYDTS